MSDERISGPTASEAAAELRAIVRRLEDLRIHHPSIGIGNLYFQAQWLDERGVASPEIR